MKVKTNHNVVFVEEIKNRIPDMQLCVELMRTDIVGGKRFGKSLWIWPYRNG